MKKLITATFVSANDAEVAIARLQKDLNIATDNISYVYRNDDDELEQIAIPTEADNDPLDEGEKTSIKDGAEEGAVLGGSIGALAGIATFLGVIPVIGPVFMAGPLVTALGLGSGALGTAAAGALTGVATGGLVGALTRWGVNNDKITVYEEDVNMGNVLVLVHTKEANDDEIEALLEDEGATEVGTFESKE